MTTAALIGAPPSNGVVRKDTSDLLVIQPMISMNALFMRHEIMATGGPGEVAATNGKSVFLWPEYFKYQSSNRLGILLHEYLHAAFAHPLRAIKMKRRYGAAFRMDVLNIAADAIINKGIDITINRSASSRKAKVLTLPEDLVCLDTIVKQAQAIVALTGVDVDTKHMAQIEKISLEWMYEMMMRLLDAAKKHQESAANDNSDSGDGSPNEGDSQQNGQGQGSNASDKNREQNEKALQDYLDALGNPNDIIISELEKMSQSDVDDAIRDAAEKLRNGIAMGAGHGMNRGSVLEALAGDIPQVKTPWEASFRSITQRHLARLPVRQPSRPGQRVLTQEALGMHKIAWSAARRRPPVPRVVVVLDSSGSIMPQEYLRYLGEIQAMKRRTNAEIYAIVADTQVQAVFEIKDVKAVTDVKFTGRGGTDFREALAMAEDMHADLVVYLTDLMGTFPEKAPPMPVVWTLTAAHIPQGYEPPFGRVIHVN